MKLSLVTISYNQIHHLKKMIPSAHSCGFTELEHIVVDGGSSDGSVDYIRSIGAAVKSIIGKDNGPSDALRIGFDEAGGEYGCFINSDDSMLPWSGKIVEKYLDKYPDTDLFLFGGFVVDQRKDKITYLKPSDPRGDVCKSKYYRMFQQGMIFKMSLYRKAGGVNPKNITCWDYELLLDMLKVTNKITIKNVPIAVFNIHAESLTGGINGKHMICYNKDIERLRKEHGRAGLNATLTALFRKVGCNGFI